MYDQTNPQQQYPYVVVNNYMPPPVSGAATAALVLMILGWFTWITFIPALICGHIALAEIERSGGRIGGRGRALTSLIISWIVVGGFLLIVGIIVAAAIVGAAAS